MLSKQQKIDPERMNRNFRAIGERASKTVEEAAKAFDDFSKACAKIDLEKINNHRRP